MSEITFEVQGRTLEELEAKADAILLGFTEGRVPFKFNLEARAMTYTFDSDEPVLWNAVVHAEVRGSAARHPSVAS